MSDNKCFGIKMDSLYFSDVEFPGKNNPPIRMNREELRETYKKFNDEITKAQTPEDKNKILDTIFPEHGKHATELALSTKEIAKLSAKKDEARNACSNNEMMQYNIERINDDVERLTEQFPELAGEIRRYADATICSAVTGKKNEVQKPAKKLPMWKKAIKPIAKLFGGKYNALDNVTASIDFWGKELSTNPAKNDIPSHMTDSAQNISSMVKNNASSLKFNYDMADMHLRDKIMASKDLFVEDHLYKQADKEFDEKAPAIMQKNKVRGILAQRGLIPESQSTKDVSGVVKVDQNIMANAAKNKMSTR